MSTIKLSSSKDELQEGGSRSGDDTDSLIQEGLSDDEAEIVPIHEGLYRRINLIPVDFESSYG